MGGHTAKQIDFVGIGGGDEKIRVMYICLFQNLLGGAVALHTNGIVTHHQSFQSAAVLINDGKRVTLGGQLSRQDLAYLTGSGNNDVHTKTPIFTEIIFYYITPL